MIRTVYLHGALRKRFGGPFRLDIETPRDAGRALAAQLPGFDQLARTGVFKVRAGAIGRNGRTIDNGTVTMRLGRLDVLHIYPVAAGAKGKGATIGKIVLGVVLIGIGLVGGFAAAGGLASAAVSFGSGATAFSISFGQIALFGASMAFQGISQLLAGTPKVARYESRELPDDRPNFVYQGPTNTVQQGGVVPWVFGKKVRVGSVVINAGIWAKQIGPGQTAAAVAQIDGVATAQAGGVVGSKKKKPKKQKPPIEVPDTLQSKSIARILELIGEGQLELCEELRSVFLEGTPIENDDGTRNFEGVEVEWRNGLPDQPYIPGFDDVSAFMQVGVVATFAQPVVRTITDTTIDRIGVTVRLPNGLYRTNSKTGDILTASYDHAVDIRASTGAMSGVWQTMVDQTGATGKCQAGYEVTYDITLPSGGAPYDVRLRRLIPDDVNSSTVSDIMLAGINLVNDVKQTYPHSALAGLTVDTQIFGGDVPDRAFDVRRIDAPIPSNYDPDTRTYNGIWDGTWKRGCTDNPAYGLWDLMTDPRYGCGNDLPTGLVDKWSIYAAGQRCDGMVSNGRGGLEPRFTFNGVLNTAESAFDVLSTLASTFQAMAYWGAGAVVIVQDAPRAPVKVVTPTNVIDGDFTYEGTALRARHSVALVTWNNPENASKPEPAYWVDPDAVARFGYKQTDSYKWGCNSEGEATRHARWTIDSEQSQTDTVSYRAALDHADLAPGDIIAVQDPDFIGFRFGGRIASCTTGTVTLDSPVTLAPGETYSIWIDKADGGIYQLNVTNSPGTYSVLTVTPAMSAPLPVVGAQWAMFSANLDPRLFMVVSNKEAGPLEYQISGVLYDSGKFDRVENADLKLPAKKYSLLPTGVIAAPMNLRASEFIRQAGPSLRSYALISWTAPVDGRLVGFEIQHKGPDAAGYTQLPPTNAPTVEIPDIAPGAWSFKVRAYDQVGQRSPWAQLDVALLALNGPLDDVPTFRLALQGNQVLASWSPATDVRLTHYRIRHTPAVIGATWTNAIDLVERASGTQAVLPAIGGTYLIKACDDNGNESGAARLAILDPSALGAINIVVQLDEAPAWGGSKTSLVSAGGVLQLRGDALQLWPSLSAINSMAWGINGPADSGIYQVAAPFDLGAKFSARISAKITATAANVLQTMDKWTSLASLASMSGLGADDWSVQLQIRTTDDDPSGSPTWSAWSDVVVGTYTARAFDFRLLVDVFQTDAQVYVSALSIIIDMEDRVIKLDDEVCPPAGRHIDFVPPFRAVPIIQMTPQDLATGDYWEITNKTAAGFDLIFKDDTATGVSRTFDLTVTGYGVQS